ncbi:hypothetical protein AC579_7386 [Pseudocercospora musae]|uniref:Uncharacterized protein n=1 Tax=Pseudocercospora musae TaxID=113226 RepID=A0A139H884_9PEZI|nr:hypothetical protein AC579_7386 [Pseudocercospora musae]
MEWEDHVDTFSAMDWEEFPDNGWSSSEMEDMLATMAMPFSDDSQPPPTPTAVLMRNSNEDRLIPQSSASALHSMNDRPWTFDNHDIQSPASLPPVPSHLILPSQPHDEPCATAPPQLFGPTDVFNHSLHSNGEMDIEELAALFDLDRSDVTTPNTQSSPNDVDMFSTNLPSTSTDGDIISTNQSSASTDVHMFSSSPPSMPNDVDMPNLNQSSAPSIINSPAFRRIRGIPTSTTPQVLVSRGDMHASRSSRRLNSRLRNVQQNRELLLSETTSSSSSSSSSPTPRPLPPRRPTRVAKRWKWISSDPGQRSS